MSAVCLYSAQSFRKARATNYVKEAAAHATNMRGNITSVLHSIQAFLQLSLHMSGKS